MTAFRSGEQWISVTTIVRAASLRASQRRIAGGDGSRQSDGESKRDRLEAETDPATDIRERFDGGSHAPDVRELIGHEHMLPSSTNPSIPYTEIINTFDKLDERTFRRYARECSYPDRYMVFSPVIRLNLLLNAIKTRFPSKLYLAKTKFSVEVRWIPMCIRCFDSHLRFRSSITCLIIYFIL